MDEITAQLNQLYGALAVANEVEKAGIQELIQGLKELIEMTPSVSEDSLTSTSQDVGPEDNSTVLGTQILGKSNSHEDEFEKFQREIEALENNLTDDSPENTNDPASNEDSSEDSSNIAELLSSLEGMKCRAPFEQRWGESGHHNAIVFNVETTSSEDASETSPVESVFVRVIFTQPLTDRMRPCQFFMEGRCRFSEEDCKFSHGELVELCKLQDYWEPNFSLITSGTRILAKYNDELWYKATVSKLTESGDCEITYERYNEVAVVPLHSTFPLQKDSDEDSSLSSDSSDSDTDNAGAYTQDDLKELEKSEKIWNNMRGNSVLGQWEKHTKGIGSKLMQRMGYVLGTGLGKEGEGRIDPIDAVVLPPGRSLDKCMELKENAGSSGANLFSVEKRLKRMQRKQKLRAQQELEKSAKNESVFNFLNAHLNLSKDRNGVKKDKVLEKLNKESAINLNKKLLNIGEHIKQVTKDIVKCREGIKRHEGKDQSTVEKMKCKLKCLQEKLTELNHSENTVTSEQKSRKDKEKLQIF